MTRPLLILRPEPGNRETALRVHALGLEARSLPLFVVEALSWESPDPNDFDGVLMTSANAARHGGSKLTRFSHLPLYVIGQATEAAARAVGFTSILAGDGDLPALFGRARPQRLLHFCGVDVTPFDHPGIGIKRVIVYQSRAIEPLDGWRDAFSNNPIVLIHSARAGARLAEITAYLGVDRSSLILIAISPKASRAAGTGWERVAIVAHPRDEAMVELANQIARTG
jgi:uroporphyrinogen-III synthase